jgi:hypothetical protein
MEYSRSEAGREVYSGSTICAECGAMCGMEVSRLSRSRCSIAARLPICRFTSLAYRRCVKERCARDEDEDEDEASEEGLWGPGAPVVAASRLELELGI